MTIKVRDTSPDIYVTPGEMQRYADEYRQFLQHHAGPKPTLEEFVRAEINRKEKLEE